MPQTNTCWVDTSPAQAAAEILDANNLATATHQLRCEKKIDADIDLAKAELSARTQLSEQHQQILRASAITEDRFCLWETISESRDLPLELRDWGEKAVPCMATTWQTLSGARVPQIRLDTAIPQKDGRRTRYLFPKDSGGIIGVDAAFRSHIDNINIPALLVEGTKQFQAAASTINSEHPCAVPFGIAGCWGWSKDFKPSDDLIALPAENRDILLCFDADISTNWMVWEAARRLEKYLFGELGARSVRFLINPGTGGDKDGLDDFLGRQQTQERRLNRLKNLISTAVLHKEIKQPRKPLKGSGFFDGNNFKSADCWQYLDSEHKLALSGDESVAVYQEGVYWNGSSLWWQRLISDVLGNDYRPEFQTALNRVALANLKTTKRVIPFQQPEPVINFRNCLLNVRRMEVSSHTPDHLTLIQLPHDWDPEAQCPNFLEWVEQVAPGQLEALMDVCSQMLDLSEWPRMVVFLYGPTRSGKSSFIRILNALVGDHLQSNVSLHDLSKSDDRFATSSLFGKVLNTFADLSSNDLADLSMLKCLTGGDKIEAQHKGRPRFVMQNQAMLVFSANNIPATSENSGAFLARVSPFEFPSSFVGREDKGVEDRILAEIPGILRLLVEALHRRKQRGNFLPQDSDRMQHFAERADKVRLFLRDCTSPGNRSSRCLERPALFDLYKNWTEEENGGRKGPQLGKHKFYERVRLAGVECFKPQGGSWCWDLIEVDPETAEEVFPKLPTAMDDVGERSSTEEVLGPVGNSEQQHPKLPIKTADHINAVVKRDLDGLQEECTAVSAVLTYSPHSYNQGVCEFNQRECSETAETADQVQGAVAVDSTVLRHPVEPLLLAGSTDPLVVDLETCSADQLWCTPDSTRPFVRLVGTDHGINTSPVPLMEHLGPLVAHNGFGFDFLALAHHHGLDLLGLSEKGLLVDTMVLETLAHPNRDDLKPEQYIQQLGLDASAERRGIQGKTDDLGQLALEAAKTAGLSGTPSELKTAGYGLIPQGDPLYANYLRGDVAAGRAVFEAQCPDGQLSPYQQREMRLMGRLAHGITYVGFRIDRPEVEEREAAKQKRVAEGAASLRAIGLPERQQNKDGSWNSPHASTAGKTAIAKAFADLGITLPRTSGSNAPSIKAELMQQLSAEHQDKPAVVSLCETVAGLVGARSSMGNLLKHATGDRVHPLVFPGQATGRCSITNPGLTVLGKRGTNGAEREVFLPDADDQVLLAIDLSKADARAVAVWSQDPVYLDIFEDPSRDINKELAAQFSISKTMAKALGHGTRYNQQARGMHNQTGIELAECERFLDAHRRRHAAVHRWIDRVVESGKSGRPLDNGFGRLLYTGRHIKGDHKGESKAFTQAPAYLGQSTTREWMAKGILELPLEIAKQIRCFLHDEVVLSVPERHLDVYKEALLEAFQFNWAPPEKAMVIPINGAIRSVPVVAELSPAGRTWADCYRGEA